MELSFSIITTVRNNLAMIPDAMKSVGSQSGVFLEHIVIDGNSTDGTKEFLFHLDDPHLRIISEKDTGIYDALNKGLLICKNEIIGILHSDDLFSYNEVLKDVSVLFAHGADVVYADLNYVDRDNTDKIIRGWKAGDFNSLDLHFGWMPPHPTFFFRRKLLDKIGFFDLNYRISADYDHMLRFLIDKSLRVSYLPKVITKMRVGGESNKSLTNIIKKSSEDYHIAKKHFASPFGTILFKNLRKIKQFMLAS